MTPIMKRTENKENAVSPVVGVMLMLVVTIVIAAVVAVFASGLATSTEKAPSVVLSTEVYSDHGGYTDNGGVHHPGHGTVMLTSLNGDDLDLAKTVISVTNKAGKTYDFTSPTNGTVGRYLKSGETINAYYGTWGTDHVAGTMTEELSLSVGDSVTVTVTYDSKYVLYEKEVSVI